jgi:uncharacterized protein YdhG (YjbR/CyaY superfamily)
MISKAATAEAYLKDMPAEKKEAFNKLRKTILENIPEGFKEVVGNGMIHYVVPHELFPAGYHCNPAQPLSLAGIAVQKNFISLHHMGMYGNPRLLKWFAAEYPVHCKTKLDMGKSCIRFKKMDDIPYELIGELMKKISVKEYIDTYQKIMNRSRE